MQGHSTIESELNGTSYGCLGIEKGPVHLQHITFCYMVSNNSGYFIREAGNRYFISLPFPSQLALSFSMS